MNAPPCQERPQRPPKPGQEDAFAEQLSNETNTASTQSRSNGDLRVARGRSCDQQIGYLKARERQHGAHNAQQDHHGPWLAGRYSAICVFFAKGDDSDSHVGK